MMLQAWNPEIIRCNQPVIQVVTVNFEGCARTQSIHWHVLKLRIFWQMRFTVFYLLDALIVSSIYFEIE